MQEIVCAAFDALVINLPAAPIEQFRATYRAAAERIAPLLTTTEPYVRPTSSRGAHPFMQAGLPDVRRDKLAEGSEQLSKRDFAAAAIARESPHLAADSVAAASLPRDLTIAIDAIVSMGESIVARREERLRELGSIAAALEPMREVLDGCKCESAQLIAPRFNVAWAALVTDVMRWPDVLQPLKYVTGFNVVFDVPDSGVFRAELQPEEIPEREFKAGNTRMVKQIVSEVRKSATEGDAETRERRKQCWIKTKSEIEKGLVFGPRSLAATDRKYGRGRWRCLGRNAILQKGKWRCIDNGKRSKHNKATRMHERITCGRADFPVLVAREFVRRARTGGRFKRKRSQLRMKHGTMDLRAAYRHVPTSQPEYTIVAVWDADAKEVVFCEVPGHNFGLTSAVVNFNRYPEIAIAAARRLLWTVSEHYYDDADTCEPGWAHGSGQEALYALCGDEFFGFGFDDEQSTAMLGSNEYLGVTSDLRYADEGVLLMDVSAKRRGKLQQLLQEVQRAGTLSSGLASSIFGKARWMLSPCYGGLGVACLPPIMRRAGQKSTSEIDADLGESLAFVEFACDHLPALRLPAMPTRRDAVVVFTDAEGKKRRGSRGPTGHMGFVVYHPRLGRTHAYAAVPQALTALLDACKRRDTYIGQFEIMAAITPFISLPREWFEGYPVELWIDNSGAMSTLISGYSGVPDCARLVNIFHFAIAQLGIASLWIDYVPSESNPADVPSRAHEMSPEEAAAAMAEFGAKVDMHIPAFADGNGGWLPLVDIARSVWM